MIIDDLARLPVFSSLTHAERVILAGILEVRTVAEGEIICKEGDAATCCFIVLRGRIKVVKVLDSDIEEQVAELEPGAILGHIALIDGQPRGATCRAKEGGTTLLTLDRVEFDRLFTANSSFAFKILDRIAIDLAGRLREVTSRLAEVGWQEFGSNPEVQAQARAAAEVLSAYDTTGIDLEGIDLDEISFEKYSFDAD
jgi:CRP/FNR family transcriptional regulator/CRP/FNR family cyclic AMP-dependent transcriptional regulator